MHTRIQYSPANNSCFFRFIRFHSFNSIFFRAMRIASLALFFRCHRGEWYNLMVRRTGVAHKPQYYTVDYKAVQATQVRFGPR